MRPRFRSKYWSCTRFADWLRGTPKPEFLELHEWDEWKQQAKQSHPVRYWLAEKFLENLQDLLSWPRDKYQDVVSYCNNRWITRSHALTAHGSSLPRGEWCDLSHRFLPCMFDELVNFVEVECAWMHVVFDENRRKLVPWWRHWRLLRSWRSAENGLEYLEWAANLVYDEDMGVDPSDPRYGTATRQAEDAQEILELYTWYTHVYANRLDPYEISGFNKIHDDLEQKYGSRWGAPKSPEEKLRIDQALEKMHKLEEEYEREETEMLHRLIDIRRGLWT